ncbi:uncharacterized protein TNCV_246571 [Trichonephila clavipes]|nr:uncharacterized protein TNCV_246571 [Trichonephila clavipes]
MAPRPLHQLCRRCDAEKCGRNCTAHQCAPPHPYGYHLSPKQNRDSSLNTTFCQSVTFHIDLVWHHCRRSCRCSGVKGVHGKGTWIYDLLLKGVWKLFVEQLLRLRLLVSLNESPWGPAKCLPHDPSILSSRGLSGRSRTRFSARVYLLVSTAPQQQFLPAHSE